MVQDRGEIFAGRSIAVVKDLNREEQWYLYQKTRELKEAVRTGGDLTPFKINDPDHGIYLLFLEDSTRTKESFRNAALFHGAKMNMFDAGSSSFNKSESLTDTIRMLFGYSATSTFIIRSPQEGVCRMLEEAIGDYARKIGYPVPAFINAGDGKHEHPTQEFLDEFSFLEQKKWDRSRIHLVLTGDLFHGRTVHSKVDGLRIFDEVHVDLVAPPELSMPPYYEERMLENGFRIRKFSSIDEYLNQDEIADIWYFTRLQLERMGDEIKDKADSLRRAVTFRKSFIDKVPATTKFYHPLPRHRVYPVVPPFLDPTSLNGWDEQSINGYFTRIIEIAMVGGRLGVDYRGKESSSEREEAPFVEEVPVSGRAPKEDTYKVGIKPVENGIVIDHIGRGTDLEKIWDHIDKIRRIMKLNIRSSHGVYHSNDADQFKGIISLPDVTSFDQKQIKMIGAVAPNCTVNIIQNHHVVKKYRMHMPPRVYNFEEIACRNENCISHPSHHEPIYPEFFRSASNTYVCKYCEVSHTFQEIWRDDVRDVN